MGKINLDNYPAFFLDHIEGKLGVLEEAELLLFLEQHPQLKFELNDFSEEAVTLEPTHESFINKEGLKREIPEENLVWYIEGTLNARDKKIIDQELTQNTALVKELELYKKTILIPELTIVFDNKQSLKRRTRVIPLGAYYSIGIAASILLILGFFFLNDTELPKKNIITGNSITGVELPLPPKTNSKGVNQNVIESSSANVKPVLVAKKYKTNASKEIESIVSSTLTAQNNIDSHKAEELKIANQPIIKDDPKITVPTENYFVSQEDEEELAPAVPIKVNKPREKNIWTRASNLLASLKSLGAKNVNATEAEKSEGKTEYTYVVGKFEFSKTRNAE